jgi:hypothetical protein
MDQAPLQPPDRNEGQQHRPHEELIAKARRARNGNKFTKLWAGDIGGYDSASEAVMALVKMLAFWTGGDTAWMDRLFTKSGLHKGKWVEKWGRLGGDTIAKALAGMTEFYKPSMLTSKKPSQAELLVKLALDEGVQLFHDNEVAYAGIPVNGHAETHGVKSGKFRAWLKRLFYAAFDKPPGAQAVQDALGVLEAKAFFEGSEQPVHVRVAEGDGKIYFDPCDPDWKAVEIDADGWRLLDEAPVKFRRVRAMPALPMPEEGGSIGMLRRFVNVRDEDWILFLGCLVAAFRPTGPYPVMALISEQGSGKSTTSRVWRALVDPNTAPVRAEPKEPRDLAIAANNAWVIALDNLAYIPHWLSDALCRLSTGRGFVTRNLYHDDDEMIFDGQRPVVVNAIEEVATRGDLLDRVVLLTCPTIPNDRRITEKRFWRRFNREGPRILGALLSAVSTGLKNLRTTKLEVLPRMADFAQWVVACSPSLEFTGDDFLEAYEANRMAANQSALESSVIIHYILDVVALGNKWEGTAADLLRELEQKRPPARPTTRAGHGLRKGCPTYSAGSPPTCGKPTSRLTSRTIPPATVAASWSSGRRRREMTVVSVATVADRMKHAEKVVTVKKPTVVMTVVTVVTTVVTKNAEKTRPATVATVATVIPPRLLTASWTQPRAASWTMNPECTARNKRQPT